MANIHERRIEESLQVNNLETKVEYGKTIKVLNRDRGNAVNANSWKPMFCKINMVRNMPLIVRYITMLYTYEFVWSHKETSHLTTALVE